MDDTGEFYPLGATLFPALHWWKFDRERLKQNLAFIARHRFDYVRVLCEVGWQHVNNGGVFIDPRWSDYQQLLGEFMDCAYQQYGLRCELVLVGGGSGVPVMQIVQNVTSVTNAGRQHMVMYFEVVNEYLAGGKNGEIPTQRELEDAGAWLKANTPNFIAIDDADDSAVQGHYAQVGNLGATHQERDFGDGDWRMVRQPWGYHGMSYPIAANEPKGPFSSTGNCGSMKGCHDPLHLVMYRAACILCGIEAVVLHNAVGVSMQPDPYHPERPSNLWEVPNIDFIMKTMRGLDRILPPRGGDGQHWNNQWAGNPWTADAIWTDDSHADHGVDRCYWIDQGATFWQVVLGIKHYVVFRAARACKVEVFSPIRREVVQTATVPAGGTCTVHAVGPDVDQFGLGGYIIRGIWT